VLLEAFALPCAACETEIVMASKRKVEKNKVKIETKWEDELSMIFFEALNCYFSLREECVNLKESVLRHLGIDYGCK